MRTEEGERSLAISALRRRLGVLTVKCQTYSLLGRLETLGPGATAAAGRRWQAAELERCWRREERAHSLATALPSLEVVPDWVWQAGLVKYSIYISHTCIIYPL